MAEPTTYSSLSGGVNFSTGLQIVPDLSQIARQFKPHGYIYDDVVANMMVSKRFGKYPVFNPADYFAAPGNLRVADRAQTPETNFAWSTEPYECEPYRLQTIITREEENQANDVLRLRYSKTIGLLSQFATAREVRLAERLRSEANGGQLLKSYKPKVQWDKGDTTVVIQEDLQKAALEVYKQSGVMPNALTLTKSMAFAIANDPTLKELIKYLVGTAIVREGQPAVLPSELFGFKVIISEGVLFNPGRPGDAIPAAGLKDVWGNSARLLYIDPNAQWGVPSTVYCFRAPVTDANTEPPSTIMPQAGREPGPASGWAVVDQWWDYDPPAVHVRAWECVDERVVAPSLGIEITEVLASP